MQKEGTRTREPRAKTFLTTTRIPVLDGPVLAATESVADTNAVQLVHASRRSVAIDPLLSDYDLERLTGGKRSTWQKKRLSGDGPPFLRLGRLVRYRQSEFERWLAAIPSLRSTSDIDPTKPRVHEA
jgi:predicted DNA-binding transcriptional regulator AlpA